MEDQRMNIRDLLHRRLFHGQERLEDILILDNNIKDPYASWLFEAGDQIKKVYCFILGHVWDGWKSSEKVYCVYCGKPGVAK